MTFLLPTLLAGLIAAAIPVVIHLLFRRRSRRIQWGAMQFLAKPATPTARKSKLRFWLLMSCRIGAIMLMALALARPELTTKALPASWRAATPLHLAIVIDHSLASARISEGQTVFDRSVDVADSILQQLRPTDSVLIILAEHAPKTLGMIQGANPQAIASLGQSLRDQKTGDTDSSIPDAIAAAEKTLSIRSDSQSVILVLSAPDANSWRPQKPTAWQRRALPGFFLPIPLPKDFSDAALIDLQSDPVAPAPSQPLHIHSTISNHGTQPLPATTARLLIDEVETDTRPVPPLAVKNSASIEFALASGIATPGIHRIRVRLDLRDSLIADDQFLATVDVLSPVPILIVDGSFSSAGNMQSSQFLRAALHPNDLSVLSPTVISLSELPTTHLTDFAAIVLNDCPTLPSSTRDELVQYARVGRGVWFILGPRTQSDFVQTNLINLGLFPCQTAGIQAAARPEAPATIKDPSHPILSPLVGAGGNPFAGSVVRKWWSLKPTDPATRVLVAAPSAEPLILEHSIGSSGGTVVVWATSAEGAWNNWNLMPNFVPLVIETARHLALPSLQPSSLTAGQPIEYYAFAEHPFDFATLTTPDGSSTSKPPTAIDGRLVVGFANTFQPGFYSLKTGTAVRPFAVNVDPRLLDRAPLSAIDLKWLADSQNVHVVEQKDLPDILGPHANRFELSSALGLLLLILLIAESALAFFITQSNIAPPAVHKLPRSHEPEAMPA